MESSAPNALVYLDDIIIYSNDLQTHLKKLRIVLQKLKGNTLLLNPDKSKFLKTQICFIWDT